MPPDRLGSKPSEPLLISDLGECPVTAGVEVPRLAVLGSITKQAEEASGAS